MVNYFVLAHSYYIFSILETLCVSITITIENSTRRKIYKLTFSSAGHTQSNAYGEFRFHIHEIENPVEDPLNISPQAVIAYLEYSPESVQNEKLHITKSIRDLNNRINTYQRINMEEPDITISKLYHYSRDLKDQPAVCYQEYFCLLLHYHSCNFIDSWHITPTFDYDIVSEKKSHQKLFLHR